jgi:hypothetical protein
MEATRAAIADLARRHGVVFVDDRNGALVEQRCQCGAGIEIASALFGVGERHQHLSGHHVAGAQRLGPGLGQRNLAHGSRGLALLQLQLALGKAEAAAPQCDGARRDDDDLGTADAQVGKIIDQRRQP